ncbi:MobA-like NTP transferase domain-containing protein [Thermosyntropha lipolytica DSM 11003]|uniref:MobA-like NTP transferase domain-containing protein n=1 Tax=Thermosyntropha lipolytica DSM 11003 TaxID=1123382 RepID=A0A1M5JQJ1_9FIRM|nr:nucleotidyltransferase family protein [Thermosyntropha lipolytica]SHG42788.1 MobA-like NTP transferase domain-containing protein [Thermosyntropha lipolytica DSM 11003]
MQYDAIILAGGQSSSELKKIAPYENEALIIIGNYPMIYYVYKALRSSPLIRRVAISGPVEALKNIFRGEKEIYFTPAGEDAVDSFKNAVEVLKGEGGITEKILIMPTDIPFITREAIEDFLLRSEETGADFCYPITEKKVNEEKFPGVKRTYVTLKEGTFTGGNLFLLRAEVIDRVLNMAKELVRRRKNPLAMAKVLGFNLVLAYLMKNLTIAMAEKRFNEVVGIKGKAIISPYAEVGVDVDKPGDLELAQKYLKEVVL